MSRSESLKQGCALCQKREGKCQEFELLTASITRVPEPPIGAKHTPTAIHLRHAYNTLHKAGIEASACGWSQRSWKLESELGIVSVMFTAEADIEDLCSNAAVALNALNALKALFHHLTSSLPTITNNVPDVDECDSGGGL